MIDPISDKRARGRYYTKGNPFDLPPFRRWAVRAGLSDKCALEPFAGANNIIKTLKTSGLCGDFKSYDLEPADGTVKKRDTIASFPQGFDVCVTNPPWFARNSATRRRLPFPDTRHDDLYKHCLELCLQHCEYVAALIPASYLQSRLFRDRLQTYILLHDTIFNDTKNPVCLSLFGGKPTGRVDIYHDADYIGTLASLGANLPQQKSDRRVKFNDPEGDLGFISFDNTKRPSIHFCAAEEVEDYSIKVSSRFITRIGGDFGSLPELISQLNEQISAFRRETRDVFLTPFKGMREDGVYRRRMDYTLARRFINAA